MILSQFAIICWTCYRSAQVHTYTGTHLHTHKSKAYGRHVSIYSYYNPVNQHWYVCAPCTQVLNPSAGKPCWGRVVTHRRPRTVQVRGLIIRGHRTQSSTMISTPLGETTTVRNSLPRFTPGTHWCYSWVGYFPNCHHATLYSWCSMSKVSWSRRHHHYRHHQQWPTSCKVRIKRTTFWLLGWCLDYLAILALTHTRRMHAHKLHIMTIFASWERWWALLVSKEVLIDWQLLLQASFLLFLLS